VGGTGVIRVHVHTLPTLEAGWYYHGGYKFNGFITAAVYRASDATWVEPGNDTEATIITSAGPQSLGGPNNTGTGPHWMVVQGDYYYIYAQDFAAVDPSTGQFTAAFTVARSAVADGGMPGTWWKWYNGGWNEPGLGGNASAIPNLVGAKMVWVEAASVWLAVSYSGTMSVSPDGFTWTVLPSAAFPTFPAGQPVPVYWQYPDRYYYTSLIPGWGGNTLRQGDTLWLYFLYDVAGNASWANVTRGLAAAPLTLAPASPSGTPTFVVSLANYVLGPLPAQQHRDAAIRPLPPARQQREPAAIALAPERRQRLGGATVDTWATIAPTDPRQWAYELFMGYLLASPLDAPDPADAVPLLDCYATQRQDHFAARVGECQPQPGDPEVYQLLGMLGYVAAHNTTTLPGYDIMPVYRCFNVAGNDSYVSPFYPCKPGDVDQVQLGWMWWQND